jgi:hypothetical protein
MKGLNIFIAAVTYITVLMIYGDQKQLVGNLVSIGAFLITLLFLKKYQSRK